MRGISGESARSSETLRTERTGVQCLWRRNTVSASDRDTYLIHGPSDLPPGCQISGIRVPYVLYCTW